jgi:hypothetical protein
MNRAWKWLKWFFGFSREDELADELDVYTAEEPEAEEPEDDLLVAYAEGRLTPVEYNAALIERLRDDVETARREGGEDRAAEAFELALRSYACAFAAQFQARQAVQRAMALRQHSARIAPVLARLESPYALEQRGDRLLIGPDGARLWVQ